MSAKVCPFYRFKIFDYLSEVYFRCFFCSCFSFEFSFCFKSKHGSDDVCREAAYTHVVCLYGLIVYLACFVDSVFGTLKLCLKFTEVFAGLQFRIVFRYGNESAECTCNGALCLLVFSDVFFCQVVCVYCYLCCLCTCVGYFLLFSCVAYPFTVLTRFGMRSDLL